MWWCTINYTCKSTILQIFRAGIFMLAIGGMLGCAAQTIAPITTTTSEHPPPIPLPKELHPLYHKLDHFFEQLNKQTRFDMDNFERLFQWVHFERLGLYNPFWVNDRLLGDPKVVRKNILQALGLSHVHKDHNKDPHHHQPHGSKMAKRLFKPACPPPPLPSAPIEEGVGGGVGVEVEGYATGIPCQKRTDVDGSCGGNSGGCHFISGGEEGKMRIQPQQPLTYPPSYLNSSLEAVVGTTAVTSTTSYFYPTYSNSMLDGESGYKTPRRFSGETSSYHDPGSKAKWSYSSYSALLPESRRPLLSRLPIKPIQPLPPATKSHHHEENIKEKGRRWRRKKKKKMNQNKPEKKGSQHGIDILHRGSGMEKGWSKLLLSRDSFKPHVKPMLSRLSIRPIPIPTL